MHPELNSNSAQWQESKIPSPALDPSFLKWVYWVASGLTGVALLCLLGRMGLGWIGGFVLGSLLGQGLLKSNEMLSEWLVKRGPQHFRPRLMVFQVGKIPLLAALLYVTIYLAKLPPLAIVFGYALVQITMLLTILGRKMVFKLAPAQTIRKCRGGSPDPPDGLTRRSAPTATNIKAEPLATSGSQSGKCSRTTLLEDKTDA